MLTDRSPTGARDERRGWRVRTGEEGDMHALRAGSTHAEPDRRYVKAKMAAGSPQRSNIIRQDVDMERFA